MKYSTILILNLASLIEALIIKILLDREILVCNITGINSTYDVIALIATKNILILGSYQIYFWSQHNHNSRRKVVLQPTALDRWIPAVPSIFWIYSPMYYVFFSLAILCLKNYHITTLSAWIMLVHASFWYTNFPTQISPGFREQIKKVSTDRLTRFIMALVHANDTEGNACPSMHCATAVFLAFITYPFYPTLSIVFPILIALSCLLSKQHMLLDIIPGFLLGGVHGIIHKIIL